MNTNEEAKGAGAAAGDGRHHEAHDLKTGLAFRHLRDVLWRP
ncbi:hypothetical protein [Thiocapsa sp. UBA6158]|nr:hypothetical protein [Thiocapsa sp. UBA6158]